MDRVGFDSVVVAGALRSLGSMVDVRPEAYYMLYRLKVSGVSPLDDPEPGTLLFSVAADEAIKKNLAGLRGCVIILPTGADIGSLAEKNCVVFSRNPKYAYAGIVTAARPPREQRGEFTVSIGPGALAAKDVTLSEGVIVEPFVTIARGSTIGPGCHLMKGCSIGPDVRMGRDCVVKEGAVVGDCGFGYAFDDVLPPLLIPQIGGLEVGDRVEIGALATIAVGTIRPTVIESDVKINNHVHIAHNCRIGERTVVNVGVSISGSSVVGRNCWLAPGARVRNKMTLGDGVTVGMGAVVVKDVEAGLTVIGIPAKSMEKK